MSSTERLREIPTMTKRARKGGEIGLNGEMYDGGKFMPSTKLPKRSPSSKAHRSNRCLVMPGMTAIIPEGSVAIFPQIREFVIFVEGKGAVARFDDAHPAVAHHFEDSAVLHRLIARYNKGQLHYTGNEKP